MELEFLPLSGVKEVHTPRILTPEEIETLRPIFEAEGSSLPDPSISQIVGCVENGEVIAFLVLQLKLHAEPMWIKEGYSHLFMPLVKEAETVIITRCGPTWVYLFAPAGRISQLAANSGMQAEPWVVFSKLVMPPMPPRPVTELMTPLSEMEPITEGKQ